MKAIDFVVRDGAGALNRGVVQADAQTTTIQATSDQEISINLRQADMQGHSRNGDDLSIVLADGRIIVIENYFNDVGPANRLFISADGYLNEVAFVETTDGQLYAQYGPTEQWGKWSPSDDLIYLGRTEIASVPVGDDEVSMLGPLALLGGGGIGTAVATGVGVAVVTGTGGGGGGGPAVPTVDDPDSTPMVGGPNTPYEVTISGTGEPGHDVSVVVGDETLTTVVGEDGTWSVTFTGDTLPSDGVSTAVVTVTGDDQTWTLDGPTVTIDTIAPDVAVTAGVESSGDVFNEDAWQDGVSVSGTGEVGAAITVTALDVTMTTTVGEDGTWSVTWPDGTFPTGEYSEDMTITATDAIGNVTTHTETLVIDTIAPEIEITAGAESNGDIFNEAEWQAGVSVGGTGEVGASITVTAAGVTQSTTVGADGTWSVTWPAGTFAAGEYTEEMTITATDAVGNVSTYTDNLVIDTVADISIDGNSAGADGILNGVEAASGITLTGSAQAGSTVDVTFGSTTLAATVDANGNWSVDFPASAVTAGEYDATVTAVATDANGNTSSATGTVQVDTYVNSFSYTSTAGGDGVINAAEAQAGLVVTGQAEPGSTVVVNLGGAITTATVAADGSWTATYGAGQITPGTYTTTMTATATDAAGNTADITQTVSVDTDAGTLTISPAPVEGDDIINAAEAADGVVLSGTADPGAVVTVTMGGVSHTVVTNAAGQWQATYAPGEITPGTYTADITATTTDSAGNTLTETDSVQVDTQVDNMSVSANTVAGDGVINAAERDTGVAITGTTEPGASVVVTLGGVAVQAVVDANGNWTANYTTGQIPTGETTLPMTVTATDMAGNIETINETVDVDTLVNTLNFSSGQIAGDNTVNASEASTGISFGGQVEAGSTVVVDFHGTTLIANVDAAGNWSLDVPASAIPAGTYDAEVTVLATDMHGNTATISDTLQIDTDAPDGPVMASLTTIGDGVRGISIEQSDDTITIAQDNGSSITSLSAISSDNSFGETDFRFGSNVPDGSNLVVTATDDAGNASSTYVVLDDGVANSVTTLDTAGLGNYEIDRVDLNFAEEAHLTINEAQLTGLADGTNTLTIDGGADDEVTLTGGQSQGSTTIDGVDYNIYSVGAGTVMIDDDITVNTVIG